MKHSRVGTNEPEPGSPPLEGAQCLHNAPCLQGQVLHERGSGRGVAATGKYQTDERGSSCLALSSCCSADACPLLLDFSVEVDVLHFYEILSIL